MYVREGVPYNGTHPKPLKHRIPIPLRRRPERPLDNYTLVTLQEPAPIPGSSDRAMITPR